MTCCGSCLYTVVLPIIVSVAVYLFFRYIYPSSQAEKPEDSAKWKEAKSIYEFTANDIDGKPVSLDKYKGNVVLVVNVATNCGFTKNNYAQLNEMYGKHKDAGLRILAFPCNQFNGQEPGCDVDIKEFATKKGIEFDMFSKINVNGDQAHPLWKYLKAKQGGLMGDFIKWNFSKFLVDREGQPVKRFSPNTEPNSFEKDVQSLL